MMTPAEMAALHARCFVSPRPWTAPEFADLLQSPHVFALTEPGGMLLGRVIAGEAELLTLAVDPDRRRTGLGHRLTAAFLQSARAKGGESAFLEVAATNLPARSLYAALDFREAGKRRGYYQTPDGTREDALILVRSLT